MSSAERTLLPPSARDQDVAGLIAMLEHGEPLTVASGTETAALPEPVRRILHKAVQAFASGRAVTVSLHRTVLTTQEAADLLGVTRPTLVRLLESGRIPFTQPGRHRRVELTDVLAYREELRADRRQALGDMAVEAIPNPEGTVGYTSTR